MGGLICQYPYLQLASPLHSAPTTNPPRSKSGAAAILSTMDPPDVGHCFFPKMGKYISRTFACDCARKPYPVNTTPSSQSHNLIGHRLRPPLCLTPRSSFRLWHCPKGHSNWWSWSTNILLVGSGPCQHSSSKAKVQNFG
jgi:hypothetical protein